MTEEERRRRRRALRRKREQQRRRRLIAAAVVAVLVLGGGAVGIAHSILRDAQTANVGSLAYSGQAGSDGRITERLQENGAGNAKESDVMARRSQEKLSRGNRRGMVVIAGVVAVLLVVFMVQSRQISVKNASYESQKEELTQKLQDEELRSGEIDKLKDYVNSTEFIEKMAREKLGLVYDDEIIFKAEK